MSNADAVYEALRRWGGPHRTVTAPIAELAVLTRLSESQVRRALAELCQDGRIEPTGRRRGKTAVFRLVPHPPGSRSEQEAERHSPYGGGVVSDLPTDATDDDHRSNQRVARTDDEPDEEEAGELRTLGLQHAYAWLDRRGGGAIGEPDQDEGTCGDCGRWAHRRWSLGLTVLCRQCRERRRQAAQQLAEQHEAQPDERTPSPPAGRLVVVDAGPELTEHLAEQLANRTNGSSNGNGRSPLWDEPEF